MQQEPQQPLNFRAAKKWQLVTQGNRDSYGYQLYAVNGLRRVSPGRHRSRFTTALAAHHQY